jgi:release factor glutamine methyltransferase
MSTLPPDYPVEYIEWKVTFFGRDYLVTPAVLIPRLETESLVRRARQLIHPITLPSNHTTIVVDIGCGSGIIGTSVADLADEVIFLDVSPEALRVAEQNFRTHYGDKKAQFIVSDLLSALPISSLLSPNTSILFLTNLPYIKDADWKNMSADTVHEPRLALFGWEKTGFEMYERLFQELDSMRLWTCDSIKVLYEFGFDQREVAEQEVQKYPQWEYSFFADYAGIERFGEILMRR